MGKTYKAQPDFDDDYDLFDEDLDEALDFDNDMDLYINKQMSLSAARGAKNKRGKQRASAYHGEYGGHFAKNLPGDWQDFDYAADSQYSDDWR